MDARMRSDGHVDDVHDEDEAIDALFTGAPEDFVAARDSLVKTLKAQGRADDARRLKSLRRPTMAAWALNQAAHTRGADVRAFLTASRDLRDAQEHGRDPNMLRELIAQHRTRQRAVLEAALAAVERHGANPEPLRAELQSTLDAAGLDPAAGAKLAEGRLSTTAAAPSSAFDVLNVAGGASAKPRQPAKSQQSERRPLIHDSPPRRETDRLQAARQATRDAKAAADRARVEVRRAETELKRAQRVAARADAALEKASHAEQRAVGAVKSQQSNA